MIKPIHTTIIQQSGGKKNAVYLKNSASDVVIDSTILNENIPDGVKTIGDLISLLSSAAFGSVVPTSLIRDIRIETSEWTDHDGNYTYTINNDCIHEKSLIDVYFESEALEDLADKTISYSQSEGLFTIAVNALPSVPIVITAIRVTD